MSTVHDRTAAPRLLGFFDMWCFNFLRREKPAVELMVEFDREDDGRVIADVVNMPGVMAYGATEHEALGKAYALALRVVADKLEHDEVSARPNMTFSIEARECLASH